jgi:hypothetical protein
MKVGDIVESVHDIQQRGEQNIGVIVDIDPLRRGRHGPFQAANEIVVLLDNGVLWHASPSAWKVKNESR